MELNNIIHIIPQLLFSVLLIFAVVYYSIANSRTKEEKCLSPEYTVWCYGVLNGFKQPGIRVTIYETFVVISHFKKIVIQGEDIDRIERGVYLTAKGVSIHLRNNRNKSIFLMPKKLERIIELLNRIASKPKENQ